MKTMKTFVMKGIGKVAFMDKPRPQSPGPNDAVIKTTRAMVCTSDVHTLKGAIGDRQDLTFGHEAVGVVHELGSEVKSVKIGDRVAINAITPCYKCENCLRGYTCDMMSTGFMGAERANIPLGGTVAVFAQGPVGLMATAGAKLLGAGMIIAVESMPNRKELALHFGADKVIDFTQVDAVEEIVQLTNGQGVDSAIPFALDSALGERCECNGSFA